MWRQYLHHTPGGQYSFNKIINKIAVKTFNIKDNCILTKIYLAPIVAKYIASNYGIKFD
jgi:hypothetical protein